MPNHVHGIIVLKDDGRGGSVTGNDPLQTGHMFNDPIIPNHPQTRPYGMKRHPLSEVIRAFKSFSAKRINAIRKTQGVPVWQRNYYEHIIRDDDDLDRVHRYIASNPAHWIDDEENPVRLR